MSINEDIDKLQKYAYENVDDKWLTNFDYWKSIVVSNNNALPNQTLTRIFSEMNININYNLFYELQNIKNVKYFNLDFNYEKINENDIYSFINYFHSKIK
jgi:hypothetical protein